MWKIFYFPHYHYDIVWKFNREDYSYINQKILKQVVKLCRKYSEFKFGIEDAYQFIETEKKNPNLFKQLKTEIEKGKIEIVDGQYLMADTFISGGEVLVREILHGKKYVKQKFKKDIEIGWLIDSFGQNSQIPQLYKDAGYKYLVFGRGYKLKPGQSEFWWKGLDGTKILTHVPPSSHSYHVGIFAEYFAENLEELKEFAATENILMPAGTGSCLFPVSALEAIKNWNKQHPKQPIKVAVPEEFFKEVEKEGKNLKIKKGEMYNPPRVFDGVWSTRIWLKLEYFKTNSLILNTEKFATIAYLLGKEYPRQRLKNCWKKMLFLAFHDVVTGCSLDEVYKEVREIFSFLNQELAQILNDSLSYISSQIDYEGWGIVVFNPTSFEIENYVEKEIEIREKIKGIKMEISDWEILEEERDTEGFLKKIKIGFLAKIPPLGYKVYKINPVSETDFAEKKKKIAKRSNYIQNAYFKVKLDRAKGSYRVFNQKGEKILTGGQLEIENEVGSVYTHRDIAWPLVGLIAKEGERTASKPMFKIESCFNEKRNISQRMGLRENVFSCFWPYRLYELFGIDFYRQKVLELEREIKVFKNLPWVEVSLKLKTHFPQVRIRTKFDLDFKGNYLAATPFGITKRKKDRESFSMADYFDGEGIQDIPSQAIKKKEKKRDFPMEDWLIYEGQEKGIALATQGIFGHQVFGRTIYLTLLRSINLISHGDKGPITPVNNALELGKNFEYKFAIFPYQDKWNSIEIWKKVSSYLNPPIALELKRPSRTKKIPSEFSFLKLPSNLILSALKPEEEGKEKSIILRCYDTSGKKKKFKLHFFLQPKQILVSNITEEKEENRILEKTAPFKIITLKLKF